MPKVLTDRTADRLMRLLNSSGSASTRGVSFADRLWTFVRCDSATAVGGNAILDECYPATVLKPVTRASLPPEEHARGVLLTLLGEDGESAPPAVGRCYAVLVGDEVVSDRDGSIAGRVRVFGVESGGGGDPESLGCHLERDGDDAIAVTPATLAGDGLEEVPGETEEDCPTLAVKTGCHATIEEDGAVAVNLETVAGAGLEVVAGEGEECDTLAVKTGCHLDIDEDGFVAVTPATLAGPTALTGLVTLEGYEDCATLSVDPVIASTYEVDLAEGVTPLVIEEDEEEEPTAALKFVVAKRHHYFRMNTFGVVILAEGDAVAINTTTLVTFIDSDSVLFNADAAARTIEAVVNRQMSIVTHADGIKLDGDQEEPGNSKYYGTDAGGAKGWHALPTSPPSPPASYTFGCGLTESGGAVAVDVEQLAGVAADTALVPAEGEACDTLAVDLETDSATTETVVTDAALAVAGGTLTLTKTKKTFTNSYNAAGLLLGRSEGEPVVTTDEIDLCDVADYCADPDRELAFASAVGCATSGGDTVLTGGDGYPAIARPAAVAVLSGGDRYSAIARPAAVGVLTGGGAFDFSDAEE